MTMRIDAHQHFWVYDPAQYSWMRPDWLIRRDFLPNDLKPLLDRAGIDGCMAVQARQSLEESRWLLDLASRHPFIRGVVGWVDLRSNAVDQQLAALASHPRFVAVRHVVQNEPDPAFMLRPKFLRGLALLIEFDLAYDLLLFAHQLPAAIQLVRKLPRHRFVLDHISKPQIKEGRTIPWDYHIRELAKFPNVYCKVSGMVTEADWLRWKRDDFTRYLDTVFNAFGPSRLMYGSDWPVCLLAGSYQQVYDIAANYCTKLSAAEQELVFGETARLFYRLP